MAAEDVELVEKALSGSEDAYRRLVRRYQGPLFSLLRRMVQDAQTAEDLTQESFVKAFRHLSSYDRRRRFSSWLFKIAHNTAIDWLRRRPPTTVPLETIDGDTRDPGDSLPDRRRETPHERLRRRSLAAVLETAIDELRPEHRRVLLLRLQADMPYEEIAATTGLPLGTVKTYLFRARRTLARRLEALGWGPGHGL